MLRLHLVYSLWNRHKTLTGSPDPTHANSTNKPCTLYYLRSDTHNFLQFQVECQVKWFWLSCKSNQLKCLITICNKVVKNMFLHLCVCPQGGGSASVHAGIQPLDQAPPWTRHPPGADTPLEPDTPRRGTPPDQAPFLDQAPTGPGTPMNQAPPGPGTPLMDQALPPSRPFTPRPGTLPGPDTPPGNRHPPDGYCCGRYASYWNAFLLFL